MKLDYKGIAQASMEKVASDMWFNGLLKIAEDFENAETIGEKREALSQAEAMEEAAGVEDQGYFEEARRQVIEDTNEAEVTLEDAAIEQAVEEVIEEEAVKQACFALAAQGELLKQAGYVEAGDSYAKTAAVAYARYLGK